MEFLIITGMSGAGKSRAADILEDLNYYCVDNLPVALIPRFAELCSATQERYEKVALVMDLRERDGFDELFKTLDSLGEAGLTYRILFMDADVPTLIKRYKESRRPHPLGGRGRTIEDAIRREAELLTPVRARADYVVNTSNLTLGRLQQRIFSLFGGEARQSGITVNITAFGYKYGVPMDADLMFDVRFLPNPYYVDALREKSGLDEPVRDYVFDSDVSREFMDRLLGLIDFLLPLYAEEGKFSLTVAVGCTGGRHRSVAVAQALGDHLREKGVSAVNFNRDLEK
ncbi:MAG TPA: RNase adapter RapZ [Oscillospiraceae bacterium]|nr:RNase adapter RapZ [Oscillospiraceae bacterium]HNY00275.1 RNase adapter RapZ [Oscillospiraceae bacterium]HPS75628.1 RNase adapter RapZ [Oscillospiraceae bacterium]